MQRPLLRWGLVAVYAAFIFWLSHQSHPPIPRDMPDKLGHWMLFAGFGFLLMAALTKEGASTTMVRGLTALILGTIYAATDEVHQAYVPGRSVELADWVADVAGLIAGIALYGAAERIYGHRTHSRRRR